MLAYSSIIIEADNNFTFSQGTLFKLPVELCDSFRISKYVAIEKDGWSESEFGYLVLRQTDDSGLVYLLPGLFLEDGPKPKKRIHGFNAVNKKEMVEEYLRQHILRSKKQKLIADEGITALVHDLRHLSSAIYHSAEQASRAAQNRDNAELADSLKTVIATQTMLKARIDYLDYTTGIERFETLEKIPVYRRVDKVVRCFRAAANDKSIGIELKGQSFRFTSGPNILDIVPYTLVDNAIKYSPKNCVVEVDIYDTSAETIVSVSSIGPVILDEERVKIFEAGFRGKNAMTLRPAGTGIGLSVAKEILEKFSGKISINQVGDILEINNSNYRKTTFRFSVPSRDEERYIQNRAPRKHSILSRPQPLK